MEAAARHLVDDAAGVFLGDTDTHARNCRHELRCAAHAI